MSREDAYGSGASDAGESQIETAPVSAQDSGERSGWAGLVSDEVQDGLSDAKRHSKVRVVRRRIEDSPIAGRYQLIRHVARGGMGSVWEAYDLRSRNKVALKIMTAGAEAGPHGVQRFRREAALASGLTGKHFPRVFGYGVEHGAPYLALEYVDGETLFARLQRQGRLSMEACRWLVQELCAALTTAHEFGVIHRDVTLKNLMIVAGEGGDELKLLDLGIAKHALFDHKLTAPGMLIGSPRYMSPEQVAGGAIDHRTDLWSVAVVLYRALVGAEPFPGEDEMKALEWAMSRAPIEPSSVRPELGPSIDEFFQVALTRNPDGRFQTAAEFHAEFDAALAANARHVPTEASSEPRKTPTPSRTNKPAPVPRASPPSLALLADLDRVSSMLPPAPLEAAPGLDDDSIRTRQIMRRGWLASAPDVPTALGPIHTPAAAALDTPDGRRRALYLLGAGAILWLIAVTLFLAIR